MPAGPSRIMGLCRKGGPYLDIVRISSLNSVVRSLAEASCTELNTMIAMEPESHEEAISAWEKGVQCRLV